MKVFLLVSPDFDDLDQIYGVYSSRESAELANIQVRNCAGIKELELDTTYVDGV